MKMPHLALRAALILSLTGLSFAARAADAETGFTLGGYFTQSINLVDIDDRDGVALEDEVLTQNAELHADYVLKLASGTKLGVHLEIEGTSEDHAAHDGQIDEHYISLTGDWGRLLVGAENGVGHLMQVRAPSFVPGLKIYDNSLTDEGIEAAYQALLGEEGEPKIIDDAHMSTKLEHISGDANKLSYITPKVGGLQFGLSFTPNNADSNGSADNQRNHGNADVQEDIIELAMSYSGRVGGVKYKFGTSNVQSDSLNDALSPESNSSGARVAFGRYVLGLNLSEYENLDQLPDGEYAAAKIEVENIGLRYRLGRGQQIGLAWTSSEANNRDGALTTAYDEWMIGGGRRLGKGLQLGYYYAVSEVDRPLVNDDDKKGAEIATLGLTLDVRF